MLACPLSAALLGVALTSRLGVATVATSGVCVCVCVWVGVGGGFNRLCFRAALQDSI